MEGESAKVKKISAARYKTSGKPPVKLSFLSLSFLIRRRFCRASNLWRMILDKADGLNTIFDKNYLTSFLWHPLSIGSCLGLFLS